MTMAVERCVLLTERDIRESPESTMAQSATARIDGLREWFSRGRIDVDELPYDSKSPTVAFRLPQDTTTIELSIDGHACTLELSHAWTNWHLADDKADLEQDATAVFKSEDPQSIDWWQTIVAQLSNFLTFLARAPCRVQEMKTEFPNASSGSRQDGMAMEVFYPDPIPLGTPRHRQTLFSAHRIGVDRLQAVLQGWFDLCAGHSPTRSVPIQYILASSATGVLDSQCAYLVAALGKMAGQTAKKEPAVQSYNEINALVEGSCLPTETKEWCASLASRGIFFESKKEQFERLLQECGLLPLLGGEECANLARRLAALRQDVVYGNSNADLSLYWPALAVLDISILRRIGFSEAERSLLIEGNHGRLGKPLGLPPPPSPFERARSQ